MALLHFNRDLENLKKQFLSLFALVEDNLRKALRSLEERNDELAREVIRGDKSVDGAEVGVEEECLKILALHQPVGQDLRYITAILKINRNLERLGDQAVAIARITHALRAQPMPEWPPEIGEIAEKALRMLQLAFESIIHLDTAIARQVWTGDDEVDELTERALLTLRSEMRAHPERLDALLGLNSLVYILERVADHATNIAKDVLYTVLGEIVRHRGKEFKRG